MSRLGSPADDRARVAELDGAIAPASRLIRRGGAREETVCAEGRAPFDSAALRGATLRANGSSPKVSPVGSPRANGSSSEVSAGDRAQLLRPGSRAASGIPDADPSSNGSSHGVSAAGYPGLTLLPLHLTTVWNSAYPTGDNDGLLWSGRGVSQLATAGATLRYGPVSASLAPEVSWSENRAFDTVPTGGAGELRFANPFYGDGIDLPQRFGAGPFAAFAPGQSYLRADLWNIALGVSSENLWIGPGVRTSILMSSAGPGFPHVFLGTTRPGNIGIGKAEALLFFGRLERSRFIEGGTHPLVSGLVLGYEPRWIPGLHVGAGRVMLQRWEDLGARDFLAVFQSFRKRDLEAWYGPGGDNPGDNQLASLFARWVFPAAGLELYGEWAREDHEWDLGGLVREPDHSQAYLLGLQKVFRAGTRRVRLLAELTHLQELRPLANQRGVPVYYVHGADLSYTNRGQLLGAWIGPGADAQTLAVDVFHAGGRIGGYVERVRRNDAYYWAVVEPSQGGWWPHDAELSVGARQVLALGRVELSWEAAASFRHNRDFLGDETNLKAVVGVSVPLGVRMPLASAPSP